MAAEKRLTKEIEIRANDIAASRPGAPPEDAAPLKDGGCNGQQPSASVTISRESLEGVTALCPLKPPEDDCDGPECRRIETSQIV